MRRPLLRKYERSTRIETMIFLFSAFYIILYACDAMITETPTSTSKCPDETLIWTWKLNNTDNIQSLTWTKGSTILLEYNPKFGPFPFDNRSSYENDSFKLSQLVPDDSGLYSMEVEYGNIPSSKSSVILNVYDWVTESPSIINIHRHCQGALLNCSIPSNAVDTTIVWADASGKALTTHYLYNATTCGNYTCKMNGGAAQCMKKNTQPQAKYLISDCNCKKTKEEAINVNVIIGICVVIVIVAGAIIGVAIYVKIFRRKNIYENTAHNSSGTGYNKLDNVEKSRSNSGYLPGGNDTIHQKVSESKKPNLKLPELNTENSFENNSSANDGLQKDNDDTTPINESGMEELKLARQEQNIKESLGNIVGDLQNNNDETKPTIEYENIDSSIQVSTQTISPVIENSENLQHDTADTKPTDEYESIKSKSPPQNLNIDESPKIIYPSNDISSQKEDGDPVHLNKSENGKAKSTPQNTNTEELPEKVSSTNGGNLQKGNEDPTLPNKCERDPKSLPQNPSTEDSTQTLSPVIENSENLQHDTADTKPTDEYESIKSKSPPQKPNFDESSKLSYSTNVINLQKEEDDTKHLNESKSGEAKSTLLNPNTEVLHGKISSTNSGNLQKGNEYSTHPNKHGRVESSPSPEKPNTGELTKNISAEIKTEDDYKKTH